MPGARPTETGPVDVPAAVTRRHEDGVAEDTYPSLPAEGTFRWPFEKPPSQVQSLAAQDAPGADDEVENRQDQFRVRGRRSLAIIRDLASFPQSQDVGSGLGVAPHFLVPHRRFERPLREFGTLLVGHAVGIVMEVVKFADGRIPGFEHFDVCLRGDVHWSTWGAYLSYRALLASIPDLAGEIIPESALRHRTASRVGDMTMWRGLRTRETCEIFDAPKTPLREVMSTKTFTTGQVVHFTGGWP